MNEKPPSSLSHKIICISCDAECPQGAEVCWLCNARLNRAKADGGSQPPKNSQSTETDQVAMILTVLIMGIVVVGVFAAAPGIGVLLGIVVAIALFALGREFNVSAPTHATSKLMESVHEGSTVRSAASGENKVLKIVVVVLSSIVALLVSVIGLVIIVALAGIAAFVSFCEACFELFQTA